jgi:hypothetical protein
LLKEIFSILQKIAAPLLITSLIVLNALVLTLLVFAVILLVLSVWAAFYFRAKYKKSHQTHKLSSETEITPIGKLKVGPTWIHGRVKSTYPPAPSPFSKIPCVYYHFYVEELVPRGDVGSSYECWVDIIDDQKSDPFWMEDDTGSVEIEHGGNFQTNTDATFETGVNQQTHDGLAVCDAPEDLRAMLLAQYGQDTKRRLIFGSAGRKLRYKESILEDGDNIYIFGEVRNDNGQYIIGTGTVPLIISEDDKAHIEDGFDSDSGCYKYVFIGSIVIAFLSGFLVLGIIGFFLLSNIVKAMQTASLTMLIL